MNGQLWEFFKTTVGVHQGCLLSSILFNLFLGKIMQETLHDQLTSICIGGRPVYNPPYADDIDVIGGSNGELQDLTTRHVDGATVYGMKAYS